MTNYYASTLCSTRAALDAAVIALDTTATYTITPYRDAATTKYILVTPSHIGKDTT